MSGKYHRECGKIVAQGYIPVRRIRHCVIDTTLGLIGLAVALSLAFTSSLMAADSCAQERLQAAAAHLKIVQSQLLSVRAEFMDTNVPVAAQTLIPGMKEALDDAINSFMNCEKEKAISDSSLGDRLAALLEANRPQQPLKEFPDPPPESAVGDYGGDLRIAVSRPDAKLNLLGIEASFSITCGEDTILSLYEWQDHSWRRALLWQSEAYSKVSGAFGDFFQYVVMLSEPSKGPLVAVAHGHPWCTSGWSGFDLDVIKFGRDNASQRVLWHDAQGYNRGWMTALRKTSKGFEFRAKDMSLDFNNVFVKPIIYRYDVSDTGVHRVQPIALNGRDFVDAWLQSEWEEALEWSAYNNLDGLEKEHRRFVSLNSGSVRPIVTFGAVRSCWHDPNIFQVELDQDPGAPMYYHIRQGQNAFTMLAASSQPDRRCNSPDLMRKR